MLLLLLTIYKFTVTSMPLWTNLIYNFIFLQNTFWRYSLRCGLSLTRHLYVLLCSFSFLLLAFSCYSLFKVFYCLVRYSVNLLNLPFDLIKFWSNCNLTFTLSKTFKGLYLFFSTLSFVNTPIWSSRISLDVNSTGFIMTFSTLFAIFVF